MLAMCFKCQKRKKLGSNVRRVYLDGAYRYECDLCQRERKIRTASIPEKQK